MTTMTNKKGQFPAIINTNELDGKKGFTISNTPEYMLGGGYSSDRMQSAHACLSEMKVKFTGAPEGYVHFANAKQYDDIQKSMGWEVSESASIKLFSQEFSASAVRDIKETAYSMAFYYIAAMKLPTAVVSPNNYSYESLSAFGQGVYNSGPDHFRAVCGDEWLYQGTLGAGLYATLTIHFKSISDKSNFTAHAGAKFGTIASVSGTIKEYVGKYHTKGGIELSAFQIGGNVMEIGNVFKGIPCPTESNPYPIVSCSLEQMDCCEKAITGVLSYGADNFSKQIIFENDKVIGTPANMGFASDSFSAVGITVGDTILTPEIEAARIHLSNLYLDTQNKKIFTEHVIESSIFELFYSNEKDKLKKADTNLKSNIKLLEDSKSGAILCYNKPEKCIDTLNKINNKLAPIDEKFIDQIENSYKFTATICHNHFCWPKPIAKGEAVAIPTDNQGHFQWEYSNYNNSLTIFKNNDGTISLSVNGGQPSKMTDDGYGHYQGYVHCLQDNDSAPHPLNTYCDKTDHSGVYTTVDLVLESIFDMY